MNRHDIIQLMDEAGLIADSEEVYFAAKRLARMAYVAGALAERKRCIDILKASYIIDDGENHAQLVIDRINND